MRSLKMMLALAFVAAFAAGPVLANDHKDHGHKAEATHEATTQDHGSSDTHGAEAKTDKHEDHK